MRGRNPGKAWPWPCCPGHLRSQGFAQPAGLWLRGALCRAPPPRAPLAPLQGLRPRNIWGGRTSSSQTPGMALPWLGPSRLAPVHFPPKPSASIASLGRGQAYDVIVVPAGVIVVMGDVIRGAQAPPATERLQGGCRCCPGPCGNRDSAPCGSGMVRSTMARL